MTDPNIEVESLRDQVRDVHEEARMVLPGVQAIFGFQLIAVFNSRFEQLASADRVVHLVALLLVLVAIGLLMTPAAYRRMCEQGIASTYFTSLGSRLIAVALVPLLAGIALALSCILHFAEITVTVPILAAIGVLLLFGSVWFAFPLCHKLGARPGKGSKRLPAGYLHLAPRNRTGK